MTKVVVDQHDLDRVLAATPEPTADYEYARQRLMTARTSTTSDIPIVVVEDPACPPGKAYVIPQSGLKGLIDTLDGNWVSPNARIEQADERIAAAEHVAELMRKIDSLTTERERLLATTRAELEQQRSVIADLRRLVRVVTAAPVPTTGRDFLVWRTHGESVAVSARQGDLINETWEDHQCNT